MTAHKAWFITCDGDGCDADTPNGDMGNETAGSARAEARRQEWVLRKGKDLCPDCQEGDR